jgi:carboxylesterase type B
VVDATQPGLPCIQTLPAWERKPLADLPKGTEDCLRLDILAPDHASSSSRLPVLVKIHGGGFVSGRSEISTGQSLLNHSNGAFLFVSFQYRLGPFGFLGSKAVQNDGAANAGLLDQRVALEWIKRYIHHFGGDPNAITVAGGSAGGGSVTAQMMLYGATKPPPFKAAIAGELSKIVDRHLAHANFNRVPLVAAL